MNIVSLLEPLASLAPSPMDVGLSARLPAVGDLGVEQIVPGIRAAVEGLAGDAMSAKLGSAVDSVQQSLGVGDELDGIADRGASAVDAAIADITLIAKDCLRDVVEHVLSTSAMPGPLAWINGAGVLPLVEEHRLRAQQRLQELGSELGGLTREVEGVEIPHSPGAPVASNSLHPTSTLHSHEGATASIGTAAGGESMVAGAPNAQAAAAVSAAKTALGTPYQWGGNVPGVGLDCSGLTQWAYAQAGVQIPRTADAQAIGMQVSRDQLAPGDLVVWDGHVAMAVGDGQMIEAGDPVQINPVRTENIGMNFLGFYRPTA